MSYERKNRRNKWDTDKDGLAPRLNELIRIGTWCMWLLIAIAMILGATFIQGVVQGLVK
jgi:hypothetical protein